MKSGYFTLSLQTKGQEFTNYLKALQQDFGWRLGIQILIKSLGRFVHLLRSPQVRPYQTPRGRRDLVEAIVFNIALYQTLKKFVPAHQALEFMQAAIQKSGLALMQKSLPALPTQAALPALTKIIHAAFGEAESQKIYAYQVQIENEKEFSFDVSACLYASLTQALNVAELGSCFCAVDQPFFASFDPRIRFERSQTLAKDNQPCDFRFISQPPKNSHPLV